MATRHACPRLRRAINCSGSSGVLQKLYIRLIPSQHSFVQKGRTAEFSATFCIEFRISNKSFGLYSNDGKYMELFEQQKLNESVQIIETKQTPSYDINVQIYVWHALQRKWANKGPCQPQPQQLQLGLHAGCYQTHTPDTVSVEVFNLHLSTYTGVQPIFLYLYRCSTYTSLSIQVFNSHFSICTRVQSALLYLYTCSTCTSSYGSFNHFHTQVRKTKGIRHPEAINIAISWGPEHRLRCHVEFSWPHFLHMNRINMHITVVKKNKIGKVRTTKNCGAFA
jgi:hypothetical protein